MERIGAAAPQGNAPPILRRGPGYPCLPGRRPLRDPTQQELRFLLRRLTTARRLLDDAGPVEAARFLDGLGFACQVSRCRLLVEFAQLAEVVLLGDRELVLHDIAALEAELREGLTP